jgi:hypothetical protein
MKYRTIGTTIWKPKGGGPIVPATPYLKLRDIIYTPPKEKGFWQEFYEATWWARVMVIIALAVVVGMIAGGIPLIFLSGAKAADYFIGYIFFYVFSLLCIWLAEISTSSEVV